MKRYLFVLIPIFVLLFGLSSYAASFPDATPVLGAINDNGQQLYFYCEGVTDYAISACYYTGSAYENIIKVPRTGTYFYLGYDKNNMYQHWASNPYWTEFYTSSPSGLATLPSRSACLNFLNSYVPEPSYDDTLTLNPKVLYNAIFLKLFLNKSSSVDDVDIKIYRTYTDDRSNVEVYNSTVSTDSLYLDPTTWDNASIPTADVSKVIYRMELVPKHSPNSFGATYVLTFRAGILSPHLSWNYTLNVPNNNVPVSGINEFQTTIYNPVDDTVISPSTTYYSPIVDYTFINDNDNSEEINNYITNNYITESPQPIIEHTTSSPPSESFDFPTLDGFLSVLKGIFALIKNLVEMFIKAISALLGQFTFLPPWFIISVSSLIGIALSVMIWLFVKNLIL